MTNTKLSQVTVYVPVNVGDGLPESKECSFIYWERDNTGKPMILSAAIFDYYNNGKFDVSDDNDEDPSNPRGAQPTHWLKEQERYIFTKDELEFFLKDFFRNAQQLKQYPDFANYKYRNPEDLIQSLF